MAYTNNPSLPLVRAQAVSLVKNEQWSIRKTARHLGFSHCTVRLWLKRQPIIGPNHRLVIPTQSSRPHHHPRALPEETVAQILAMRAERRECAEVLHYRLSQAGVKVSLSSVKRVLARHGCSRFSKWKKWHQYPPRPLADKPGKLVQIDSMHDGPVGNRLSLYALIDVCSRWGFALPTERVNCEQSFRFLSQARRTAPFSVLTVQSDHGSEYAKWFTKMAVAQGMNHRHSRVRTPTDNAHVERFIQTLQMQCLNRIPRTFRSWQKELPEFLEYYNNQRPHLALNMKTPRQWLEGLD